MKKHSRRQVTASERRSASGRRSSLWFVRASVVSVLCGAGCDFASSDADAADAAVSSEARDAAEADPRCVAAGGVSNAPRSIEEVVTLINALPKPLSLPCFIGALSRPLSVQAARSVFSAQPAQGKRSPRIFVFLDPLVVSVVPEGTGSRLLEFGERRTATQSLKAELEFPIDAVLTHASPYARLPYDNAVSSCAFCHAGEMPAEDVGVPFANISQGIKPMPGQRVQIVELSVEASSCDDQAEPERCAMLRALFGRGTPIDHEFPEQFKTFF